MACRCITSIRPGDPLIVLHGAYMNIPSMGGIIPKLAESHRVYALELQGHGRTTDIERPITYPNLADDVAAFMDAVNLPKADLFGYSMGAAAGLQFAIRHPGKVGRLVAASAAYDSEGWQPAFREFIPQMTVEMFTGMPFAEEYRRLAADPDGFPALVEKLIALEHEPMAWEEDVKALTTPVLVIAGDADVATLEHSVAMFRLLGGGVMGDMGEPLPQSRLAVMPATSHTAVIGQVDLLHAFIEPFLKVRRRRACSSRLPVHRGEPHGWQAFRPRSGPLPADVAVQRPKNTAGTGGGHRIDIGYEHSCFEHGQSTQYRFRIRPLRDGRRCGTRPFARCEGQHQSADRHRRPPAHRRCGGDPWQDAHGVHDRERPPAGSRCLARPAPVHARLQASRCLRGGARQSARAGTKAPVAAAPDPGMAEIDDAPDDPEARLSAPVPLTIEHDLAEFDCGEPMLNDWLRHRALKNESRFSRTYVVCAGDRVVGYFCISAGAVQRAAAPGKVRRNAPDTIPVSVIGRLTVSREHAGKGLGADLLADALRRIALASRSIGIGAVLVHVKDDAARRFYLRCAEFIEFPEESRTLFLPIETVVAAFGQGEA